jgi:hypothetical protein
VTSRRKFALENPKIWPQKTFRPQVEEYVNFRTALFLNCELVLEDDNLTKDGKSEVLKLRKDKI